jgi:hypothetical protein
MVILLGIALLLLLLSVRERYVVISGPGVRPSKTAEWLSKIDAEAPIGADDGEYITVLQQFYDQVYKPARTENPDVFLTDAQVKAFVDTVTIPTVDKQALRKIITAGFAVDRTGSSAIREEQQLVKTGALVGFKGENLSPEMGKPPDFVRIDEATYTPVDSRKANLPEGIYTPTGQQETPRREGVYDNDWAGARFYSVCEGEECAKNVL